jgi:glutathione S-transferase
VRQTHPILELYQAEWCPSSHRVRQVLTELGLDFVARQVPAEPAARRRLQAVAGVSSVPVLVVEDGSPIVGEVAIVRHLETHHLRSPGADAHRTKAARVAARARGLGRGELPIAG